MKFANLRDVVRALTAPLLIALCLLGAAPSASAVPILQVDGSGILTGVDGLMVDGTPYDVTFAQGSCISVYASCTGFTFNNFTDAQNADQAFANVISASPFATDLTQIQGCALIITFDCAFITPYATFIAPDQNLYVQNTNAIFFNDGSVVTDLNGSTQANFNITSTGGDWVVWTPAAQSPNCSSSDPNFFHDATALPSINGASIGTTFNFNAGLNVPASCSLTDIANAYGYNHFNWKQVITNYPSCPLLGKLISNSGEVLAAPPSFIDPPLGGYLGQYADQLPYYYDEGANQSGPYALSQQEHGNMLTWSDQPYDDCEAFTNQQMAFTTSLVGVYANETSSPPLATIDWTSDAYCIGGCTGSASAQDIAGDEIFNGGITSAYLLDDPTDVPPDVLALLESQPTPVPEPGTLALISGGLAGMFSILRRKQTSKRICQIQYPG